MGDIFAIQDEIAAKVVDQLKITLLGPPPVVDETDPEVYALVLQARHINATLLRDSLPLARELLERAIGLAPDYLPARAELGRTYYLLGAGQGSRSEWYAPYRAQFEEVSKRWPNSARANSWLGYITFYFDHDFPAAAAAFERALAAEPTNQDTLQTFLIFVLAMNRPELAIEIGEYLLAREPLCINPCYGVTMSAYVRTSQHERFDAAYAAMQALGLDVAPVARIYIDSLLRRGDPDRALGQAEMMELPAKLVYAAIAHHRLGQLAEYEAVMAELRERARFAPALVYAQVGELDAAFDIVMGLPEPVSPDVFDWDLAPLRQHPRWPELAARSGIWPTDPRSAIHLEVNLPN
jgi:tetratricopeptide (TPR) repeat protein